MKKKVLYVFFLLLYLLLACTLLSRKIEVEMATQVQITERRPISANQSSMPLDPLFYEDGVGLLYEVTEGSGWSSGLRTTLVPEERWSYEEFGKFLRFVGGKIYWFVETASRQPIDGGMVEIIETFETGPDQYLLLCPEGIPDTLALPETWTVAAQDGSAMLLTVPDGTFPFFQHRARIQTGIPKVESSRFISLTEARNFFTELPDAALVITVSAIPVLLWLLSCLFVRDPETYRIPLLLNIAVSAALLAALPSLIGTVDLPASMLPRDNIFAFSHYKQEFAALFDALNRLGDTALWDLAQQVKADSLRITAAGAAAGILIIAAEYFAVALVNKIALWRRNRYRGKYLAPRRGRYLAKK